MIKFNHKAEINGWEFKFIAPEGAHKNYEEISKKINDDWEKNNQNKKSDGFVYQKP